MTIGSEIPPGDEEEEGRLKRKTTARIKKFFKTTAKKAASKAKSIASEVSHVRRKEDIAEIPDVDNPDQPIKIKASKTNTGPYEFANLKHVQDLSGDITSNDDFRENKQRSCAISRRIRINSPHYL
jgi:WD repeat-containing protein 44